jgi:transposase
MNTKPESSSIEADSQRVGRDDPEAKEHPLPVVGVTELRKCRGRPKGSKDKKPRKRRGAKGSNLRAEENQRTEQALSGAADHGNAAESEPDQPNTMPDSAGLSVAANGIGSEHGGQTPDTSESVPSSGLALPPGCQYVEQRTMLLENIKHVDELKTRTPSNDYVETLAEAIMAGAEFPPLTVDQEGNLIDGGNRVAAYELAEVSGVLVDVYSYSSMAARRHHGIELNRRHGKPYTREERMKIAIQLGLDGVAIKDMATMLDTSERTLRRWTEEDKKEQREQLEQRAQQLHQKGASQAEIASALNISRNKVRSLLGGNGHMAKITKQTKLVIPVLPTAGRTSTQEERGKNVTGRKPEPEMNVPQNPSDHASDSGGALMPTFNRYMDEAADQLVLALEVATEPNWPEEILALTGEKVRVVADALTALEEALSTATNDGPGL